MIVKKRLLPILVAVLMVFVMMPSVAFATDGVMYYHTNGGLLDVGNGPEEDPQVVFNNFSANTRSSSLDINGAYLPEPVKDGDEFLGWYQDDNFSGSPVRQTYAMTGWSSSMHLYAKWKGDGSASGTWGTCPWSIDSEGVLTVNPGTGLDTAEYPTYSGTSPWSGYEENIHEILFVADGSDLVVFPENANNLLANMENLQSVDFSGVDASGCKYMRNFLYSYNGSRLKDVDLSTMNNAAPLSMSCFFSCQTGIESVTFGSFDTSKVTDFYSLFNRCSSLNSVDLGNIDTSSSLNMSGMFSGCMAFDSIDVSHFDMSRAAAVNDMFANCTTARSIKLPAAEGSTASCLTDINGLFSGDIALEEISGLENMTTSNVTDMRNVFRDCKALAQLDLSSFDTSSVLASVNGYPGMENMFNGCDSLSRVTLGKDFSFYGENRSAADPTVLTYLPVNNVYPGRPDQWWSETDSRWYKNEELPSVHHERNTAETYTKSGTEPEEKAITTVDIGNIWDKLDPVNTIPFTAEVHDETDPDDGVNFNDKMELYDEAWIADHTINNLNGSGTPLPGRTYEYQIVLKAKDGWFFTDDFTFIYGGSQMTSYEKSVSDDGKVLILWSFRDPVAVKAVDISGAEVTGIAARTYNGKAQTQSPTVKMNVNGTVVTLKFGTDYTLTYNNNKNAGNNAAVTINGIGIYKGAKTVTFTISKALNPLSIKAGTASVKYSKLKKKTQTLAVTKVIKFTKKLNDKKTYTLVSAKKGSKSFKKYFKINKTTGKVTVKKGLKKGTYKVKVKVQAAGNANYKASAVKTVTFKVKVK